MQNIQTLQPLCPDKNESGVRMEYDSKSRKYSMYHTQQFEFDLVMKKHVRLTTFHLSFVIMYTDKEE